VEWIDSDARSQASTSSMKDSSSNSGRTPAANRNQTSLACRRAVDRGSCYGRTTTKLTQLRGRADGRGKRQVDGHATGGERWGGRIRDLQIRRCRRRQARRRRWMRRGRPAAGAATDRRRADLSRPRPRGRRIRDVRTRWRADPADGGRGRRRLGYCCLMNAKGSRDRRSGTRRRGATTGHGDDAAPGRKLAAAALLRLHLRKRNGFGDEDAAPRSKMKLPGAAQRRREGWWPDST